jgi:two-component system cell cycle sensor histidine kinase/response regulator CckA
MRAARRLPAIEVGEQHRRFQTAFQSASIGIGICSLAGLIVEVNAEFASMLGFAAEELINANILGLDPICCILDLPGKPRKFANEQAEGSTDDDSTDDRLQDGRLLGELLRGERTSIAREKRYRRKNGSDLWGRLTVSLGRNLQSEPAFLIALLSDATEGKKVEEHLREAEQMEIIGRLAGGIAHDFNNLLTGILLYCDLLRAGLENNTSSEVTEMIAGQPETAAENDSMREIRELSQHVEEMRLASEQGAALTRQLLTIARRRTIEPIPVALNDVVMSTRNLLRRLIGENIELLTDLDANCGAVLADPGQLRQILLNVVLNARDALPGGGTITLSTRLATLPAKDLAAAGDYGLRPAAALLVKDNGSGMDALTQSRIFEPLFTTKKRGTGLGLMTVQRIISENGGTIRVVSALGCGTSVEMFFPSFVAPAEKFATESQISALLTAQPVTIASEPFVPSSISPRKPSNRKVLPVTPLCSPNALRGDSHKSVTHHLKTRGDPHV